MGPAVRIHPGEHLVEQIPQVKYRAEHLQGGYLAGQGDVPDAGKDGSDPEGEGPAVPVKPYNVMDIDFETLMASGQNDPLYPLHKYFSSVEPTRPMSIQGCSRAAT